MRNRLEVYRRADGAAARLLSQARTCLGGSGEGRDRGHPRPVRRRRAEATGDRAQVGRARSPSCGGRPHPGRGRDGASARHREAGDVDARDRRGRGGLHRARAPRPAFKGYRGFPARSVSRSTRRSCTGFRRPTAGSRRATSSASISGVSWRGTTRTVRSPCAMGDVPRRSSSCSTSPARASTAIEECRTGSPALRRLARGAGARGGPTASRSCAPSSATGSAARCTKSRRSRTSGSRPRACSFARDGAGDRADGHHGKLGSRVLDDGWTAVTRDGSLAAHFEHTVAVTDDGPEVLTSLTGQSPAAYARVGGMAKGRRDRGRGHGGGAAAERDVPGRAGAATACSLT